MREVFCMFNYFNLLITTYYLFYYTYCVKVVIKKPEKGIKYKIQFNRFWSLQ